MSPLLVRHSMSEELPVYPSMFPSLSQVCKPHFSQEMASCHENLESCWTESSSSPGACSSSWLQVSEHQPCSSSRSQKPKNNKNLWNPTYGSWVLESLVPRKTTMFQSQSMPLSCSSSLISAAVASTSISEHNDSGTQINAPCSNKSPTLFKVSSSPGSSGHTSHKTSAATAVGSLTTDMDLVKLHSFPCDHMNYLYNKPSSETKTPPIMVAKSQEPSSSSLTVLSLASYSNHKPLVKRHASYGHEDVRRHKMPEKPTRDRDSGFSLSEDLSVLSV